MVTNALSLDFEEWFHPELLAQRVPDGPRERRAGAVVAELLGILERFGHRCTFFVLSDTVQAYPDLIRQLEAAGHEIAMHGHTHDMLYRQTPERFDGEIKAFLAVLRECGIRSIPKGYRAPTFSLNQSTSWALQVLTDNGFQYDSSIFPLRNHVYGVSGAPLTVYRPDPADLRNARAEGILEFPMSVACVGPAKIPASGGFYFRVMPYFVASRLLRKINRDARPFVFYFHPWELDPGIPRVRLGLVDRLITYTGIGAMKDKLMRLFESFKFERMDTVLGLN